MTERAEPCPYTMLPCDGCPMMCAVELAFMRNLDAFFRPSRQPPRRHVRSGQCSGKEIACLPGLGGTCVACGGE